MFRAATRYSGEERENAWSAGKGGVLLLMAKGSGCTLGVISNGVYERRDYGSGSMMYVFQK